MNCCRRRQRRDWFDRAVLSKPGSRLSGCCCSGLEANRRKCLFVLIATYFHPARCCHSAGLVCLPLVHSSEQGKRYWYLCPEYQAVRRSWLPVISTSPRVRRTVNLT